MNNYLKPPLADIRLNKRFGFIIKKLFKSPDSSIPQVFRKWKEIKATYRFFGSKCIKYTDLVKLLKIKTLNLINKMSKTETILLIQDTTEINYTSQSKKKKGYIHSSNAGFLVHSLLAVKENSNIIGLVNQDIWMRKARDYGKRAERKNKPIEQKESYRWIQSIGKSKNIKKRSVLIGDRESDIYELFIYKRPSNLELLVRASHNRKLVSGERLLEEMKNKTVDGVVLLKIPQKQKLIDIEFTIQYLNNIKIKRPEKKVNKDLNKNININCIRLYSKKEEIEWILLTTIEITNLEEAKRIIKMYSKRWIIERFHYVLKSGCQIEKLQLKNASSTKKAIVTYSEVALKILALKKEVETEPNKRSTTLGKKEEEILERIERKMELTNIEAVKALGKLGGFIGRRSDGVPGVKSIWLGLKKLYTILEFKYLLNNSG